MTERTYTPRKEFSARVRAEIMARDEGRCRACGRKVGAGAPFAYDHIVPVWCGGESTVENGQLLCETPCHADKTRKDNREAKKGARIRLEAGQQKRRKEKGSSIPSRGFQKRPDGVPSQLSSKSPGYVKPNWRPVGDAARAFVTDLEKKSPPPSG